MPSGAGESIAQMEGGERRARGHDDCAYLWALGVGYTVVFLFPCDFGGSLLHWRLCFSLVFLSFSFSFSSTVSFSFSLSFLFLDGPVAGMTLDEYLVVSTFWEVGEQVV